MGSFEPRSRLDVASLLDYLDVKLMSDAWSGAAALRYEGIFPIPLRANSRGNRK